MAVAPQQAPQTPQAAHPGATGATGAAKPETLADRLQAAIDKNQKDQASEDLATAKHAREMAVIFEAIGASHGVKAKDHGATGSAQAHSAQAHT